MPAISLLSKTYTYTNGNPNDADEVELDLSNAYANFGTLQTDYNQLVTGAYTIAGVKTFSSPITLSANNASVAGSLGYSSNVLSYYNGTKRVTLPQVLNAERYFGGKLPTYTSAASITLPTGLVAMDSTNANLMTVISNQVISLASSGANGLDTGSEASNTWYHVYLIGDSTGVNATKGVFSVTNEAVSGSITLPSGYNIKRQLPLSVRNDGSSNIIPFVCPRHGEVVYDVAIGDYNTPATATVVANNISNTGSYADIDLSALVPPISKIVDMKAVTLAASSSWHQNQIRPNGSSHNGIYVGSNSSNANVLPHVFRMATDSSQVIEYQSNLANAKLYAWVTGYVVTEVL